ncbi:hypothetical protein HDV00_008219 [Rhizophlyctis rosea]|nr:hypothetical protein HDV00_008219 [Rhizophlyctis rosea]
MFFSNAEQVTGVFAEVVLVYGGDATRYDGLYVLDLAFANRETEVKCPTVLGHLRGRFDGGDEAAESIIGIEWKLFGEYFCCSLVQLLDLCFECCPFNCTGRGEKFYHDFHGGFVASVGGNSWKDVQEVEFLGDLGIRHKCQFPWRKLSNRRSVLHPKKQFCQREKFLLKYQPNLFVHLLTTLQPKEITESG